MRKSSTNLLASEDPLIHYKIVNIISEHIVVISDTNILNGRYY